MYPWFDVGDLARVYASLIIISFKLGYCINDNINVMEISHAFLLNLINVTLQDMQSLYIFPHTVLFQPFQVTILNETKKRKS